MAVHLLYDPRFLLHDTGVTHLETRKRLESILKSLDANEGLNKRLHRVTPRPATERDLARCHSEQMIREVRNFIEQGGSYLDSDTPVRSVRPSAETVTPVPPPRDTSNTNLPDLASQTPR